MSIALFNLLPERIDLYFHSFLILYLCGTKILTATSVINSMKIRLSAVYCSISRWVYMLHLMTGTLPAYTCYCYRKKTSAQAGISILIQLISVVFEYFTSLCKQIIVVSVQTQLTAIAPSLRLTPQGCPTLLMISKP